MSVGSLRYAGRLFQVVGPDTLQARSPNVDSLTGGTNGVGTNFGVGVEEARPKGPRARNGVLGEGTASPPHQPGGLQERCKLPQRGPGRAPATEGFSCILSRQIAFPSISVRVAYSLHG